MNTIFVRLFIDFLLIVVPGIVLLVLIETNPTFERGFYCDDESLHYPYTEDTVTILAAGLVAGLAPALIIALTEALRKRKKLREIEGRRRLSHNLYAHLGPFIAGLVFQQLTAEIGKHIIGRLRPHFLTLCEPKFLVDGTFTRCTELEKPWNHYVVVDRDNSSAFVCENEAHLLEDGSWDKTLQDSVKSFPSAHSAVSFYGMLYLAVYFQKRADFYEHANILTIFFQMTFLVVAFAISLSRISDYKHHWSDVLSGAILGSVTAILIHRFSDFCLETSSSKTKTATALALKNTTNEDEEAGFEPAKTTVVAPASESTQTSIDKSTSRTTIKTTETTEILL